MHLDYQYLVNPGLTSPNSTSAYTSNGVFSYTDFSVRLNGNADVIANDKIDTMILSSDFTDANGVSLEGTEYVVNVNADNTLRVAFADNGSQPQHYIDGVQQGYAEFTGGRVLLGAKYTSEITLNKFFPREGEDIPIVQGRCQLDRVIIDHDQSFGYDVTVVPDNAEQATMTRTHVLDAAENRHSKTTLGCNADTSTIKISTNKPETTAWVSYEIHGRYSTNQR